MTIPLLILAAFGCGFLANRINLPPLVGYLAAGFILHASGIEQPEGLEELADLGILLLLFSIGLKLKLKNLMRPEIWACGSAHMVAISLLFATLFLLASLTGLGPFSGFTVTQALLIGFGFSFSSTVFAVKTFEERGDAASLSANTAIGVLIIQDIAAVLYLTFTTGKYPSPAALLVIPLILLCRPLFLMLLDRCGHRELLLLFGMFGAIVLGATTFELIDLKPDLGALFAGVLLAKSKKASELSETLMNIKDLLLVGFFLNIGLSGLPTPATLALAVFFIMLLPGKSILFHLLFSRFRLRSRTALFTTLSLTNYSEFGLLVTFMGVQAGLLDSAWLIAMALSLSLSFVISAPLNDKAPQIYSRFKSGLAKFERSTRLPYDTSIECGAANVLIFGMGRIGTRAYDALCDHEGFQVLGIDYNEAALSRHKQANRNVVYGDATDQDLWETICTRDIKLAMLTMESHQANLAALKQLKSVGFDGEISAIAKFEDEQAELLQEGASEAYDLYLEAGQGFADELLQKYSTKIASTTKS